MKPITQSYVITRNQFENLRTSLASTGLVLVGDSGEVKQYGADVVFNYDGTTLALTINHAPHWPFGKPLGQFAADIQAKINEHHWTAQG